MRLAAGFSRTAGPWDIFAAPILNQSLPNQAERQFLPGNFCLHDGKIHF
jgi:hypothetical protein